MARTLRRFRLLVMTGLLAVSMGAVAAPAAAAGLTVVLPCGCTLISDQPVGNAPHTPALTNPSGVVVFGP